MEMEQRILAVLHESWQENIFALLNTIIEPRGDPQEPILLQHALKTLLEREHIQLGLEGFVPRNPERFSGENSLKLIADLSDWFNFDRGDPHWTLARGDIKKERIPIVYVTESGRQLAHEIQMTRGYQWWRKIPR